MSHPPPRDHFKGKSVVGHLKEARSKGAIASAEVHGSEMPGSLAAAADAAKETALVFLLLWFLFKEMQLPDIFPVLFIFSGGWLLWKAGRSALLGWARLNRLHRLIEEERWEIEHHREQEREELTELYQAKGFEGKLLEEVVAVLMADDNRLLRVMLEEELGLTLEIHEHPLKQAAGAAFGVLLTAGISFLGLVLLPLYGVPIAAALALTFFSALAAKLEKNDLLSTVIWTLSLAFLSCGTLIFLTRSVIHV